ncbi:fibronectin type III domain-containing protein [Echinococcus multilocularis]|uniref:Fibronectin type III domain-containing protein n=1 Tax=Echinococcus multilocularis TaxID=6211 RepID=A0A068Y0G4_ECHMU|nr:fibronectin type III domain-containing protein [Echinococcus multilocularis]
MAYRLCFILLATCVYVGEQRGDRVEADHRTTETPLLAHFYWSRVGSTFLRLSWLIDDVAGVGAEQIEVTAQPTSGQPTTTKKAANVTTGKLKLDGLEPNTVYEVLLKVTGDGIQFFNYTSYMKTWPTAPSKIPPPEGSAASDTVIELRWSEPNVLNGILQPYRLTCLDAASKEVVSVLTKSNTTTSATVGSLHPDTLYQCRVVASTVPADGQNPEECETHSELSSLIRTMPAGEKEGYATTSTSAVTSIVSGMVFTHMVVALA